MNTFYNNCSHSSAKMMSSEESLTASETFAQISAGKSALWGIRYNNEILVRTGISCSNPNGSDWIQIEPPTGKIGTYITSSDYDDATWLITSDQKVYRRTNITDDNVKGTDWEMVDGTLVKISASLSGVWGLNAMDEIFYRDATYRNTNYNGEEWLKIDGALMVIQ